MKTITEPTIDHKEKCKHCPEVTGINDFGLCPTCERDMVDSEFPRISFEITKEDPTGHGNYQQMYMGYSITAVIEEWKEKGYEEPEYFASVWERDNDGLRYDRVDLKMTSFTAKETKYYTCSKCGFAKLVEPVPHGVEEEPESILCDECKPD